MSRSASILSVVVVMTLTVLATVAVAFAVPGEGSNGRAKVTIWHKDHHAITVAEPAVSAHLRHGDCVLPNGNAELENSGTEPENGETELENGDTELVSPEDVCQSAGALPEDEGTLPEEPSEGATLTTDASDATLPDGTISDVATLDVPEGTTGTIEFKLYGPFAADAVIGEDDCVDPDPEADPPLEGNLLFTLEKLVPDDEDSAVPGQYTSDPYTPEEAGIYQWTASFTPDSGEDVDSTDELGCGEAVEQSVVKEASSTSGTEQNMTLAGEIGENTDPADPATDTSSIEGTNQQDNTTLGTDSDDHLFGDSSANILLSRHGNDFVDGGQGPDRMVGGAQGDRINAADGEPGNDVINGGLGTDYCVGDVGDKFKNCDGNVFKVPVPSESAAPAEASN